MALRLNAQKFIGLICAAYFSGCIALSGSQAQNAPTAAQSQAPATPQAAGTSPSAATPQATATPQAGTQPQLGAESRWPLTVQAGDAKLTLYQPQLDSWDGYHLMARIATRVELGQGQEQEQEQKQTLFGVLNVSAETVTDKGEQTVLIRQAQVAKADFPSASPEQVTAWSAAISKDFSTKSRSISLARLEADLEVAQAARPAEQKPLRNGVPHIIFSPTKAILINVDGEPVLRAVNGTLLERVINTRPLLVRDKAGHFSLKVFDGWMSAPALTGPWTVLASPSAELNNVFQQTSAAHQIDPLTGQGSEDEPAPKLSETVPGIFVATRPSELIVTEGPPQYAAIEGTKLLYVTNTTGNVFKDSTDNKTYLLVAGRWFRADSESGPWTYVAANALPADFAKIPDDSPKENIKASIAGTDQAREASIAASIPQVAGVATAGTTMPTPQFDGEPVFKPIEGTSLAYVSNTPTPIIRVTNTTFFAVVNGVWFTAGAVRGPWAVAQSVPPVIYTIPASSSLYYVTSVRVYDSSPTTVYVGYTPGYQGTVVDPATGVTVYGTGYAYTPWVGSVWYGTPVTYGYAADVVYTPWAGWAVAFGIGWAWGAATTAWGWGWGAYPYWGAWGAAAWGGVAYGARGGAVGWGPRGWAGYTGNIYSQWGNRASVTRGAAGFNAWTGNAWAGRAGASYNSRTGVASAGQRGAVGNVYTGNYAAGQRGVASGPNGAVAARQGVAGNAYTGSRVSGTQGRAYNRNTGETTSFGKVTGANGGSVARVGDDLYAGRDGDVYRNNGGGWQQSNGNGGWNSVSGDTNRQAARETANRSDVSSARSESTRNLDQQRAARQTGSQRSSQLQQSSSGMSRSMGMRGGGGRRR